MYRVNRLSSILISTKWFVVISTRYSLVLTCIFGLWLLVENRLFCFHFIDVNWVFVDHIVMSHLAYWLEFFVLADVFSLYILILLLILAMNLDQLHSSFGILWPRGLIQEIVVAYRLNEYRLLRLAIRGHNSLTHVFGRIEPGWIIIGNSNVRRLI